MGLPGGASARVSLSSESDPAKSSARRSTGTKPPESGEKSSRSSAPSRSGSSGTWVICVSDGGYPASLEPHKVYRLLRAPAGTPESLVRVVDESGEDYLYPRSLFLPLVLPAQVRRVLEHRSADS
jgi:hypothetical protein